VARFRNSHSPSPYRPSGHRALLPHLCACALGHIQAPPRSIYHLRIVVCPKLQYRLRPPPSGTNPRRPILPPRFRVLPSPPLRLAAWASSFRRVRLSESLMDSLRGCASRALLHFSGLQPIPDRSTPARIQRPRAPHRLGRLVHPHGRRPHHRPAHLRRWAAWPCSSLSSPSAPPPGSSTMVRTTHGPQPVDDGAPSSRSGDSPPTVAYVAVGPLSHHSAFLSRVRIRPSIRKRDAIRWLKRLKRPVSGGSPA